MESDFFIWWNIFEPQTRTPFSFLFFIAMALSSSWAVVQGINLICQPTYAHYLIKKTNILNVEKSLLQHNGSVIYSRHSMQWYDLPYKLTGLQKSYSSKSWFTYIESNNSHCISRVHLDNFSNALSRTQKISIQQNKYIFLRSGLCVFCQADLSGYIDCAAWGGAQCWSDLTGTRNHVQQLDRPVQPEVSQ